MNYSSSSFTRNYKYPPMPQTYGPYHGVPTYNHLSQMSQMSQLSQQPHDFPNNRYPYDKNSIISVNNDRNEPNYKNFQGSQANINGRSNTTPNLAPMLKNIPNTEQIDIQTLISPVLLKGYNVLKECELNTENLDKTQASLRQKLKNMKEHHQNFKRDMQQLIGKAEQRFEQAKDTMRNIVKTHREKSRIHSVQNPTKKQKISRRQAKHKRNLSLESIPTKRPKIK